ncbi:MAG: POTRA domain-containing protein, partial [Burkholderiaceae bacterium]
MSEVIQRGTRIGGRLHPLAACLGLLPLVVAAQTPPAPSAGSLLQQAQPSVVIPAPSTQALPPLAAPRAVAAPLSGGPKVTVRGFRLAGIDAAQAAMLTPLLEKYVGEGKTLADLEDAAKDIEVVLQRQGTFLAQAYVPEQNLADGVVTLQVLEGRIGAVKLDVKPGVKVSAEQMAGVVARLQGNPVARRELVESALFTLGDLRGVLVTSALTPGAQVGQADLTITVAPGPGHAFSIDFDNGGSIFTGPYRFSSNLEWFNLAGRGDVASLKTQFSTSFRSGFLRASWLTPINSIGTKLGLAASYLRYSLGTPTFEPLDANGTASALSVQLLHPMIRSRNSNLFLQASADRRDFRDNVNAIQIVTKKGNSSYFTFGAVGDFRDALGGGGITNYTANVIGGSLKITSLDDYLLDQAATGYQTAGRYVKLLLGASRLQVLPNKDYLYLSGSAQIADKNLDSSEKFSLGGPLGVRGYPAPESPSDSGALLGWEYRHPM